jgi:ubiquinone/menaquinone biosynthesis C-methylase UbiE
VAKDETTDAGVDLETAGVRAKYDDTAGSYDRRIRVPERLLFKDGREWVCARARGQVLEIAVGTGRNLAYYPPAVEITGVELSSAMAGLARARARDLGRAVDLRVGDAQSLEFPDESFDTVVCTLALCTIPDDRAAVAEAWRVLRPGGRFLLLEHVRSPLRSVRAGQRLLEPLFLRFAHDHLLREPLDHLRAVGFDVERQERYSLGIVERIVARKPEVGIS